jgi:hypothetical protein
MGRIVARITVAAHWPSPCSAVGAISRSRSPTPGIWNDAARADLHDYNLLDLGI